jgi:hypothetical protein
MYVSANLQPAEKHAARAALSEGMSGEAMCYRGYGAGKLASTVLDGGDWATALSGTEMQAILTTPLDAKQNPDSCVPGPPTDAELQQWQRSIKPVTFFDKSNNTKGKLQLCVHRRAPRCSKEYSRMRKTMTPRTFGMYVRPNAAGACTVEMLSGILTFGNTVE